MNDIRKIKSLDTIEKRVETGALQINADWPGLFIRGDECIFLLNIFNSLLSGESLKEHVGYRQFLSSLYDEIAMNVLVDEPK